MRIPNPRTHTRTQRESSEGEDNNDDAAKLGGTKGICMVYRHVRDTLCVCVCVCASECACPARHMPHMPHMHANKAVQQQPQRKLKPHQTKPNQVAFPLRVFIHKIEEHKKMAQRLLPPAFFVLPPPLPLPLSLLCSFTRIHHTTSAPFCATNNSKGARVHCTCVLMYLKVKSNESTKKKETEKVKKQSRTR